MAENKLTITDSARNRLLDNLKANPLAIAVKLSIKPSGCSGWMYVLDLIETKPEQGYIQDINKVPFYVEDSAIPKIKGTTLDFEDEGLNKMFKFHNPNVTTECGCGESFKVN